MKKNISIAIIFAALITLILGSTYWYIEWFGWNTAPKRADVIIVLGAAVWANGPSPALMERITLAETLYQQGYAATLITTGGIGRSNPTPEGSAARQVLISHGIPANVIYEEVTSSNTRENLVGALNIMRKHGWKSAVIVIHDFHLLRAMTEARRLGIEVSGAGVHETAMFRPPLVLREVIANLVKAIGYNLQMYHMEEGDNVLAGNNRILLKALIVMTLLPILAFTACARSSQSPKEIEEAVALVNGQPINKEALEKEMLRMQLMAEMRVQSGTVSIDEFLKQSGRDWSKMSPEEKRYYLRAKRQSEMTGDKNEAFNRLVREEVLYQEAVKEGYEVSIDEARRRYQEIETLSQESLKEALKDAKAKEEIERLQEVEKKFMELMGFTSPEALTEYRVQRLMRTMPISRLREKFKADWGNKHPEIRGDEFRYMVENRWEDYTNELLRQANIRIKDKDLEVIYE
ncbi:hypothetical protein MTCOM_09590 [Moorella thermoacetica]